MVDDVLGSWPFLRYPAMHLTQRGVCRHPGLEFCSRNRFIFQSLHLKRILLEVFGALFPQCVT